MEAGPGREVELVFAAVTVLVKSKGLKFGISPGPGLRHVTRAQLWLGMSSADRTDGCLAPINDKCLLGQGDRPLSFTWCVSCY